MSVSYHLRKKKNTKHLFKDSESCGVAIGIHNIYNKALVKV